MGRRTLDRVLLSNAKLDRVVYLPSAKMTSKGTIGNRKGGQVSRCLVLYASLFPPLRACGPSNAAFPLTGERAQSSATVPSQTTGRGMNEGATALGYKSGPLGESPLGKPLMPIYALLLQEVLDGVT